MLRGLVIAVVVGWVGVADAGPTRKVTVESDPPGASVYLNDKEDGEKCKTPCSVDAPIGDATLIIELENHKPEFAAISVPKRGTPKKVTVKLEAAVGTLVVAGTKGASISVDDVDQGKSPARIETAEGGHHVVATLDGHAIYDQFIEVTADSELAITLGTTAIKDSDKPDPDDGHGDGGGSGSGGEITTSATPSGPRAKYLAVAAVVDVGFRSFTYENNQTKGTLREESESGQVIAGPLVEVYPGALLGLRPLRGLRLSGRFQFNVNSQDVVGNGITGKTSTFWQSFEVSLAQRWTFANKATIEVGAGYVRDRYQFNADNAMDLSLVPDADYKSVRIGGRGSMLLGNYEPFLTAENRIVLSGGNLEKRFNSGSASGLRGSLGIAARFGSSIRAKLEASLLSYSWEFKYDTTDAQRADGGTDSIKQVSVGLGYAY